MREIVLTNGMVARVDAEDFERLKVFRWHPAKGRRGAYYARRFFDAVNADGTKRPCCREMQRDVLDPDMAAPRSLLVDHRDHDTLNNQKYNLRFLDHQKSMLNRRLPLNNTTGFRGVSFKKKKGDFQAQLMAHGVRYSTRHFATAEEAARAYNDLARIHHGEHAQLNIIPDDVA